MLGTVLNNRYRLDKKIGEGGFAQVYLATDLELERQVALKMLDQNWAKDQEFLGRFRSEARAVARLEHPNILPIYDFGVAQDTAFLVMPYISGGTFATKMRQGRLTLDEIGFYLEQIGSALDYAHQHGIVHRDVKPGNMLLRNDGRLVLTDFGLAKLLDNASAEAPTGVLGTVAYMAPEQFRGLVSSASDIYALGVLFYQMLIGRLPYEGNTREILLGHLYSQPTPLTGHPQMQNVDTGVTRALDVVLAKVLAKQPSERYPNCQVFAYAYRQAIRKPSKPLRPLDPDDVTDPDLTKIAPEGQRSRPPKPAVTPPPVLDATEIAPPRPNKPATPPPLPVQYDATEIAPPQPKKPVTPPPLPVEDATEIAPKKAPAIPPKPPMGTDAAETIIAPPRPVIKKPVMLRPARLLVMTEPDQGYRATFELKGDEVTLGREADNKIHIPLPIVSRHHAVLKRLGEGPQGPHYKIVDLKSINHLYFRRREVPEKVLEDGDVIEIGVRGFGQFIVIMTYHAPVFGEL